MFKLLSRDKKNEMEVTVSNRTIIRVLALVILSVLFVLVVHKAEHALLLIFIAFFLTLALNAPVHWLAQHLPGKRKGSRSLATVLSVILVLAVFGIFLASIVPPLYRSSQKFINTAPSYVRNLHDENSSLSKAVKRYHLESQVNKLSSQLSDRLKNATGSAVSAVTKVGSSAFSVLTILVLTFMMLVEGPRWVRLFSELLPDDEEDHAKRLAADMYRVIRGYVNGQVLLAAIASLLILPMLFILHISYPLALVVVVFTAGLIPMVGHTIGAIIITIVAVFHSPVSAIIILAYYILYQQIENYLIQPRIQANSTNMSPLLVFIAVVVGVSFSGLLGGLVAIPLMGCLRILVLDQLRYRHMLPAKETIPTAVPAKADTK